MSETYYTKEKLQDELNYQRAQKIAELLLDSGLISIEEFNRLSDINFKTFPPLLAEIYPDKA
ncbi:SHOCT domain-containing protein [Eubacterium sp. F2]|jgi:predicted transcriptional regulator|uniref:SHOCT domain-containing protein n=1 Tax=Eubacterium sp. F2 TaxID=3381348 RepID=UPI003908251E